MKILEFNADQLKNKYNILIDSINTGYKLSGQSDFTWLMIPPKSKSIPHRHHEIECLTVIKGKGTINSGTEQKNISPGSFIVLEAFDAHTIENHEESDELIIMSTVYDDLKNISQLNEKKENSKKYFVTSTPPTPNGDLHLGHLAGPYLRADILRRFLRMQGHDAFHITGQDDHQSYTAYKANTLNQSSQNTANYYGKEIETTLKMADIEISYFTKPKEAHGYLEEVSGLFKQLFETNKLVIKDAPSLRCKDCHLYLYEVYVKGICPHCQQKTSGNFCENCGRINDCADLLDPVCAVCGKPPERVTMKRAYLPLQDYAEELAAYHASIVMNQRLKNYCEGLHGSPLPDVPVSHFSNWGIPCTVPELNNQVISVWFEMGLGHLASYKTFLKEKNIDLGPEYNPWQDQNTFYIQCFGFDNSFFNCFLFPATYMALDKNIKLPQSLILNEFYYLEGLKFSTSRNHLIWGKDFFKKYSSDIVRWYLCYTNPEDYQTTFSEQDFKKSTDVLIGYLTRWFSQLNQLLENNCKSTSPATGLWEEKQIQFYQRLKHYAHTIKYHYSPNMFSLRSAATLLLDFVKESILFLTQDKTQKGTDEFRTSMALDLLALKIFCSIALPIMPKISEALWHTIGYKTPCVSGNDFNWIPAGQVIGKLTDVLHDVINSTRIKE